MEQVCEPVEIQKQNLEYTKEYRRLHGHFQPAITEVCELERTFHVADRVSEMDEISCAADTKSRAQWFMARPSCARNGQQESLKIIETTKQSAQAASDWFSKLAKLFECQIHFRNGNVDKAMSLASQLVDFDAPVDIELSIFYPLCIEVLIANNEVDKALQIVEQILVLLKDCNSKYKTKMLVLRAWADQSNDHGEEVILSPAINSPVEPLTQRELEILHLLNSHLPAPEIANLLALSVNTVRTHIKNVYAKLGVHNRTTAIDVSRRLKLLA